MVSVYAEGKHKGGHDAGAHWMSPTEASEKPNPIKSDAVSIERGKKSYFQYCSSCHGAKAMGDGPAGVMLKPKPANLKVMAGGHPDGDFAWKIANGRGSMPAWKSVLKENDIWDLVNYIQNLKPKGSKTVMAAMDHSKMDMSGMKGMDHSKMSMEDMQKMMKKMMPKMDTSKMSMQDMQKMMESMKGNMGSMGEHSDSDGHHDAEPKPKPVANSHDKPHSH